MLGGQIFMILALAFVLARISQSRGLELQLGERARLRLSGRQIAYGHLAIAILCFAYFYPLWTGLPMGDRALLSGFPGKAWFPTWI
jgi:dolichyl-phosphate-mannose--protein O-mannosyl transferase